MNIKEYKPIKKLFIPRYNELALFLMSISFLLVFISSSGLRADIDHFLFKDFDIRSYLFVIFFTLGITYSIFHIITRRKITDWEKISMIFFAIVVNSFTGIAAGLHQLDNSSGLIAIFPAWNIINAALLLIMYRLDIVNKHSIIDGNPSYFQAILGSLVVVSTFSICHYVFGLYWALTLSICVTYSCNINSIIQHILPRTNAP